jgi:hypothetical protein
LIGAYFVAEQLTDTIEDICKDFVRYLDRWPAGDEEADDEEYTELRESLRRRPLRRLAKRENRTEH